MNCLEEVKQFYASTSKEYLDYIRNCERKGKQKEVYEILADSLFDRFERINYKIVNEVVEWNKIAFTSVSSQQKIDVCCILIEDINFSPKSYNIVVRAKAQEKNIEKECRFSSLNASVSTSIFEMLNKQFQL